MPEISQSQPGWALLQVQMTKKCISGLTATALAKTVRVSQLLVDLNLQSRAVQPPVPSSTVNRLE